MTRLSFVGLGAMGSAMAARLSARGHAVLSYDTSSDRISEAAEKGVTAAQDLNTAVEAADLVLLSLPSPEVAQDVARQILPVIANGCLVADLGTMTPTACRDIAADYASAQKGFVDVPVTGGPDGAAAGTLRVFAGGAEADVARARPVLECLGTVQVCGPSGSGQAVKLVNQLCMGLTSAVLLEALAYGVSAGVDPGFLARAVGGQEGWRREFFKLATQAAEGRAADVGIKHAQLAYALSEIGQSGIDMPMTRAAYETCRNEPPTIREANRLSPSYWRALHERKAHTED